jgi:hypothetical protein
MQMVFKAIVITPNEKTTDFGSLLAIARAEACRREGVVVNPSVRALVFVGELGVYVAVYEVLADGKLVNQNFVNGKMVSQKMDSEKSILTKQNIR